MLISDHILDNTKLVESPNYSERIDESDIRLIVIWHTSAMACDVA